MKLIIPLLATVLLAACDTGNDSPTPAPTPDPDPAPVVPEPIAVTADFNTGAQSWSAAFSDYPVDNADIYELQSGIADLPDGSGEQGFHISGQNRSDDLFMFLKVQVTGLQPSEDYTLHGNFSFFSNGGEGCAGIGGAPGESVYVKLGATELEPEQADYCLNVDKGNQSQPGNDALVVGDIATPDADCSGTSFGEKTIEVLIADGFEVQSSTEGSLWVFLGTDSGYEGLTELFYTDINLVLTPSD